MNSATKIRDFVVKNFLYGDVSKLKDDDTSFLESGIVDSTGILELILFVQATFGIKIEAEEMVPENMDTVRRMSEFVTRKLASSTAVLA